METKRSLVLVTVDCLRADHAGFLGYHRPTTPFLDALARESMIFPAAVVGGAPTYYSFPAIIASRHPLALGRDVVGLAPNELTLASVLQESGYATAGFAAGNPYLSRRFGYHAGFDTFCDFLDVADPSFEGRLPKNGRPKFRSRANKSLQNITHRFGPLAAAYDELYFQYCHRLATVPAKSLDELRRFPSADEIVDQARAWLASLGESRFFLWLHLMDPHSPYYPTEKALALMGCEHITDSRARYLNSYWNRSDLSANRLHRNREDVIALYDAGIRWVDTQVARLVESLRRLDLWDDCVFALTADHGEEFLDHGGRYHLPSLAKEEIIRVPLLFRVPGMESLVAPKAPFSHLNLAPTLLDAMHAPIPPEFQGRSWWTELQNGTGWDGPAIVESVGSCTNPFRKSTRLASRVLAVRESRYKLVIGFDPFAEQLFDLESDPRERHPLPRDAEKPTRRRLLDHARQHLGKTLQVQHLPLRLNAQLRDLQLELARNSPIVPRGEPIAM
jgi:arylsulfatase A-like enzyme